MSRSSHTCDVHIGTSGVCPGQVIPVTYTLVLKGFSQVFKVIPVTYTLVLQGFVQVNHTCDVHIGTSGVCPGQVVQVTYKLVLQGFACEGPGVTGPELGLVGPALVYIVTG